MTTPENLRKRQRRVGGYVLALAAASFAYGIWDSHVASERDECVVSSFSASRTIQEKKSDLAQQSSDLQALIDENQNESNAAQTQVIKDVSAATDEADVLKAFAEFNERSEGIEANQRELLKQQAALLELRKNTELPPFPTGSCD